MGMTIALHSPQSHKQQGNGERGCLYRKSVISSMKGPALIQEIRADLRQFMFLSPVVFSFDFSCDHVDASAGRARESGVQLCLFCAVRLGLRAFLLIDAECAPGLEPQPYTESIQVVARCSSMVCVLTLHK